MTATTFSVPDMTCGHCEKTVRNALSEALPGADITINLAAQRVTIEGDAATAEGVMRDVGYSPERVG
jgi:copper chaperone